MRQRLASFQQGCRGWLTSKVTGPMRKMSPMQTDASLKPAMVRFSPNAPQGMSGMRNSSRHFG